MNDEVGTCTLWVKSVVPGTQEPARLGLATPDGEQHVVILKISTESVAMHVVFRRADLARMLALPNDGDPVEVAVGFEENDYE